MNQNSNATKGNQLIVKSNHLIESSYHVSLVELKILSKLTSKISKKDEDFKTYSFNVKDLVEEFNL